MGSALSVWEYFLCWESQTLCILAYILLGSFLALWKCALGAFSSGQLLL